MKKNFTSSKILFFSMAILLLAQLIPLSLKAQVSCQNATVVWSENFGTGTTATTDPDILTSGLTYQATGSLSSEGTYRVINNTQQKAEWQASPDHTGNANGKMLVVNGQAENFYQHTVANTKGFVPGNYVVSIYVMNIDTSVTCGPDPLLPVMTFNVQYLSQSNTWVSLSGSPYTANAVAQTKNPTWVNLGSSFSIPDNLSSFPKQIRVTIGDGTEGGCGNDFAVDDIQFSLCPAGGVAPVTLTNFSARSKGNGVSLDWSTSQELNNNYFQVERSDDGNTNWSVIATVNGAGNSQVVNNYNAFDANPISGINYYRLKQVDNDGRAVYSKTVTVKISLQKTSISVIANPFYSTLSVSFVSATSETVTARLVDVTGKEIAMEKWSVYNGTSKKDFSNLGGLQHGMYILSIINNSGEVLYNSKVVKQ
ncbi:MAG: T9SS type A sorting domain-containing protein [Ginsengibacter sp.]